MPGDLRFLQHSPLGPPRAAEPAKEWKPAEPCDSSSLGFFREVFMLF